MTPVELNMEVQEVPTDLSKCYTCKETICGKMFQYVIIEGDNENRATETKYKLCESCYNLNDTNN
jgi:hypothetical protein